MDYPLNSVIETLKDSVDENVCKYLIMKSLKGLLAVHDKKIIHRDIKSDNILISKNGNIKLCDFGLSAQLTREAMKRTTDKGTPHWTAPEII